MTTQSLGYWLKSRSVGWGDFIMEDDTKERVSCTTCVSNMESARWSLGSGWLRPRQTVAGTPSQVQMSPLLLLQPVWDEVSVA